MLRGRGQPDHLDAVTPRAGDARARYAVLLEADDSITRRAPIKFVFGEEVVDQERQHEQRPQQRLIVALLARERRIAADARIGVVDRRHALPVRGAVAQAALADVGGFDHEMRRHREIAEQGFACGDAGMLRGDHFAKSPHRNVAEILRRRKQLPVFQLIAEHGVGDVVGGEGEARDLDQQRVIGQRGGVGQLRFDRSCIAADHCGRRRSRWLAWVRSLRFTCRDLCAVR